MLVVALCHLTGWAQDWSYPTETVERLPYEYGDGSFEAPYVITRPQQLADLAWFVNNGSSFANSFFELGADIDLNPAHTFNADGTITGPGHPQCWVPIGAEKDFRAHFDGKGHTIRGLYSDTLYHRLTKNENAGVMGLFGRVLGDTLRNFVIDNSLIVLDDGAIDESVYNIGCGALVGDANDCVIYGCTNKASIRFAMTADKYSVAKIGGIAGITYCDSYASSFGLHDCTNHGEIICEGDFSKSPSPIIAACGGIVGQLSPWTPATIWNCKNYANVDGGYYAGGIFGNHDGDKTIFQDLYNNGVITGQHAGGIAASTSPGTACDIHDCTNEGDIFSNTWGGGMIGHFIGAQVSGCKNRGNVTGGSGLFSYSYVTQVSECYNTGTIVDGCGLIGTAQFLQEMSDCYNTGNVTGAAGILGISEMGNGVWDEATGTWKDEVRIIRCYNTGNVQNAGAEKVYAAGIMASSNRKIIIQNCYNQGDIEAISELRVGQAAGIFGTSTYYNETDIQYCYNTGHISGSHYSDPISKFYSTDLRVADSYYLEDCVAAGSAESALGESKSLNEFTSGTVCILLNSDQEPTPWGQEIGVDPYPVLSGTGNPPASIPAITATPSDCQTYDLYGRKVRDEEGNRKGIYISNRRKLLLR